MTNFSSSTDAFVNSNTDAYLNQLLTYIPPETAVTFTDEQLKAIKIELSTFIKSEPFANQNDCFPISKNNFFSVPLTTFEQSLGKQPATNRCKHPLLTVAHTLAISTFILLIIASCFGSLILVKRKMNINLFPNIDFPDEAVADLLCSPPSR
ncbi:MAG: hypothetical protein F6K58_08245 [Symploca sp. SIO2E9]|nr:hypothetical protein [Symploca sp. SIO2E9]